MNTLPTISLNGTSKDELLRVNLDALHKLREADALLRLSMPHARDYQGRPAEHYQEARDEQLGIYGLLTAIETILENRLNGIGRGGYRS